MTNLKAFSRDEIEVYIDMKTGESFASVSGYSRMSGVPETTVRRRLSARQKQLTNLPQTSVGQGFERSPKTEKVSVTTEAGNVVTVRLIDETTLADWLISDNVELAKKMMACGARVFMHGLVGYHYEVKQEVPRTPEFNLGEYLEKMTKAYIDWRKYTSDKPGLESVYSQAIEGKVKALPGLMTLSDALKEKWDNLTIGQKAGLGRMVADTYKSTYLSEASHIWRTVPDPSTGRPVKRQFKVYPTDFTPQIECCLTELLSRKRA